MVEGLFFYGVDMLGYDFIVDKTEKRAPPVLTHAAYPRAAFCDQAGMRA